MAIEVKERRSSTKESTHMSAAHQTACGPHFIVKKYFTIVSLACSRDTRLLLHRFMPLA